MPEKTAIERDVEDIVSRREALTRIMLGSLALSSLAPILAVARSVSPQAGDYCAIIEEVEEKEWETNELVSVKLKINANGDVTSAEVHVLKGEFEDVYAPFIAIFDSEGEKEAAMYAANKEVEVLAYATDLEFITFTTSKKTLDEILDEAIERAAREKKRKVERYMKILKETRKKGKTKRRERKR